MRKFIIKITIFSLPIFIVMNIADNYISATLKNNHKYSGEIEVWNDIYEGEINSEIAIYGSSRAWVHIDPKIVEDSLNLKTYNFGINGHSFWLQYLRHKEYLKFNRAPKLIVLAVDIYSLNKRNDLFLKNQFLPFMYWNKNIFEYTSSYEGFAYTDYYVPFVRYYGSLREHSFLSSFRNKNDSNYRYKGYRGKDKKWNNDLKNAKLQMTQYEVSFDPKSVDLFDQFLLECETDNIEVVLIYTPEYIEGQNFIKNRESVIDMFNDFSKKYNLLFIDYSKGDINYKKEYFYNASHLNKTGAELFTKELVLDLKQHLKE